MIPVQIRFTRKMIEKIDGLIQHGVYSNRSEAIRDATRRLVLGMMEKDDGKVGIQFNLGGVDNDK
jgi:Arc/MetJ-type ribon-helix-helix transcriptional regulator